MMVMIASLQAQPVSEYNYKLDNGITVKNERCWNQVWIQQSYANLNAGEKAPLAVNIRAMGDLISSSTFKLLKEGKEVKLQGAVPGTYNLKLSFKLSGKAGMISLIAGNIIIKPNTKTSVSVILYDYQILIDESPASINGLSYYETKIYRYKGNSDLNLKGIPSFYALGKHDKTISPDESKNDLSGKIKPGTYDFLITIDISGQKQKIWLENFIMKPDINYKIAVNLNGGIIIYTGGNKNVKDMHLYPAGTAASQTGTPSPIKNMDLGGYENPAMMNACRPASYDVLLAIGKDPKYEWRKNIVVTTGSKTEVK